MSFLEGTSKPDDKRRKDAKVVKGAKVDPLLKKVMSRVFTKQVMTETSSAYQAALSHEFVQD